MSSALSLLTLLSCLPSLCFSSYQACNTTCGPIAIHYPFGTGTGCGSPAFQGRVSCTRDSTLTFTTSTGSYPIQSIDYTTHTIFITDPSMSTCACANPSPGFSLTWDAPFSFADGNLFALLDCEASSSSPLYTNTSLCIPPAASPVCGLLYSCPAIGQQLSLTPISTCCIYSPMTLGPAFEMDLKKLQCRGYTGVYSFARDKTNPEGWRFGMAVRYKFNENDGYLSACADCEKSNGACGFTGVYESFTCNCPGGMNTTSNCYFPSVSGKKTSAGLFFTAYWWVILWML